MNDTCKEMKPRTLTQFCNRFDLIIHEAETELDGEDEGDAEVDEEGEADIEELGLLEGLAD